jgi:flagellar motor component MotA
MPENSERYEPGMVSLAREVLKDGLRAGEKHLDRSIWAEFLLTHQRMMRSGMKQATVIERTQADLD